MLRTPLLRTRAKRASGHELRRAARFANKFRWRGKPEHISLPLDSKYTVNQGGQTLRIAVIGGGPGGLYFAYLWKKRHPEDQVDLFEQNPADATWGLWRGVF
ncbi:hypothetical protein ACVWZW_007792 [Bradyrhizobium sp. F1.13.4]